MDSPFLNILALIALILLLAVTGGVGYLTVVDWRDRRLQDKEKRELRRASSKPKRR